VKRGEERFVEGVLSLENEGTGVVHTPSREVPIPRSCLGQAIHGDRVRVCQNHYRGRPLHEGSVVDILERDEEQEVGGIVSHVSEHSAYAFLPALGRSHYAEIKADGSTKLLVGDRVLLRVTDWMTSHHRHLSFESEHERGRYSGTERHWNHGRHESPPLLKAVLKKRLGPLSDAKLDTEFAKLAFHIRTQLSKEALVQLKEIEEKGASPKKRTSLVDLDTITIDPKGSLDLDDAISLAKDKEGNTVFYVHIADVGSFIPADTPLDQSARKHETTTYFSDDIANMLPKRMSDRICSLVQGEERPTVTVIMTFDNTGKLLSQRAERALVRSDYRYNYTQIQEILDGKVTGQPCQEMVLEMGRFTELLRKKRESGGAIDVNLPGLKIEVDQEGETTSLELMANTESHFLVEEFMVQANFSVGSMLAEKGEAIYRVQKAPEAQRVGQFVHVAHRLGCTIDENPSMAQIGALLQQEGKDPLRYRILAEAYFHATSPAYYSTDKSIGHASLGGNVYCQYTSPIRRYTDEVNHRSLTGDSIGAESIDRLVADCSPRNRNSAHAEKFSNSCKIHRYFEKLWKGDKGKEYKGYVQSVSGNIIRFVIPDLFWTGGTVRFHYGQIREEQLRPAGSIRLKLSFVDMVRLRMEWDLVP